MFMNYLIEDGDIDEMSFSFLLAGTDSESYIDFGAPNPAAMDGEPVYLNLLPNNPWWATKISGFRFDEVTDSERHEYSIESGITDAITDTGTSCIYGPTKEMDYIIDMIIYKIQQT